MLRLARRPIAGTWLNEHRQETKNLYTRKDGLTKLTKTGGAASRKKNRVSADALARFWQYLGASPQKGGRIIATNQT